MAATKIVTGTLTDASGLSDTWTATITIEDEPTAPPGIVSQYLVGASTDFSDSVGGVNGSSHGTWDATPGPLIGAGNSLFKHVNMVPFVNSAVPTFGKGAQFEFSGGSLQPQSIRMLA